MSLHSTLINRTNPTWDRAKVQDAPLASHDGNAGSYRAVDITLTLGAGDDAFISHLPEEKDAKKTFTVTHLGESREVTAWTGNIYFAVVPLDQVQGRDPEDWPSPIYLASNYDADGDDNRRTVGSGGVWDYLVATDWYTDNSDAGEDAVKTTDTVTLSSLPVSILDAAGDPQSGPYAILFQQIDPLAHTISDPKIYRYSDLSDSIESVANDGGGLAQFTATGHSFSVGDAVQISGTTDYNGEDLYITATPTADTFKTGQAYVSSQTGTIKRQYDAFRAAGVYMSGEAPFTESGWTLTNFAQANSAANLYNLDERILKSRIRSFPGHVEAIDVSGDYPVFHVLPSAEYPDSVFLFLRGWYFDSVDVNSNALANVPFGFYFDIALEEDDGGGGWQAQTTSFVPHGWYSGQKFTNPNAIRNGGIWISGLESNLEYRLVVTTASKGNTQDGDGDDDYEFQGKTNIGDGYATANMATAIQNLLSGSEAIPYSVGIDDADTSALDNAVFILLKRVTPADISYSITPSSSGQNRFDLAFTVAKTDNVDTLTIAAGSTSTEISPAAASSVSHTFTGLTEDQIETGWTITVEYTETTIEFVYQIGTSTIGSFQQTADGVFETVTRSEPTLLRLLDSTPDNYRTKTITIQAPLGASQIAFAPSTDHDTLFTVPDGKSLSSVGIMVEDHNPFAEPAISYFLVVNNQEYPITPINRDGGSPVIYHINSILTPGQRQGIPGMGFIDTDNVTSYVIRTRITRPESQPNITPVVMRVQTREFYTDEVSQ